ncbi:MAG: vWA domain-containing protein, partial [Lentisphaeria bacterium]
EINRLTQAKKLIREMRVESTGNRVGMVIFSGTPLVACPLTTDYSFFYSVLDSVSPDSIRGGGTSFENAITYACKTIYDTTNTIARDMIMLTDGGDLGESVAEAAKTLEEQNIRLLMVGIGDAQKASPIALEQENGAVTYITHNGSLVRSKLESKSLQQLAALVPSAKYVQAGVESINLSEVYWQYVKDLSKIKLQTDFTRSYDEEFQWFLAIAVAFIFMALCIPKVLKSLPKGGANLLIFVLFLSTTGIGEDNSFELPLANKQMDTKKSAELVRVGISEERNGNNNEAKNAFILAYVENSSAAEPLYNLAQIMGREGNLLESSKLFLMAGALANNNKSIFLECVINGGINAFKYTNNIVANSTKLSLKQIKELKSYLIETAKLIDDSHIALSGK